MKHVYAILWRNFNQATFDTLAGKSKGQYDIRLGSKSDYSLFFKDEKKENITGLGGFDINIEVQAFGNQGDSDYVDIAPLCIRYMGNSSARKDWNIPSQRPATAYPLWVEPGRFPASKDEKSYVLLIRTTDNEYYGRILLEREVPNLPAVIQTEILKSEAGLLCLDAIKTSSEAEKIYDELMNNTNLLMYGPPGTGKTTLMQEVVEIFEHGGPGEILFDEKKKRDYFSEKGIISNSKVEWTTFHQSFSYEEFIIGMTTDSSSSKLLDIKPRQGKLIELCEYARVSGNRALLVIDELNRANVSKVFGEFITVIEPDKRLKSDGTKSSKTVELSLPYLSYGHKLTFTNKDGTFELENPFTMPFHVYTLASMNSVDKSIFPLDSALRRRFHRHDIYLDSGQLELHFGVRGIKYVPIAPTTIDDYDVKMLKVLVKDVLNSINKKIKVFLGKDYTLGGSYIWNLSDAGTPKQLIEAFRISFSEQIYPQLEEIFRNREEQLMYILGCETGKISPCEIIEPSDDELDLGAVTSIIFDESILNDLQFIEWMERISI